MVRGRNQRNKRRAQAHSGLDPIQQILNARTAILLFLRKRVGEDGVAQDLFQQSLLRALEHQSSLRRREDAVAWFYSILRHTLVDYLRKRAVEVRGKEFYSQALTHSGHGKVPLFEEVAGNLCCCAYAILPSLRPSHAELIRRIDLGGESSKTVAQALAMTCNNVRVRLHRARLVLRARFSDFPSLQIQLLVHAVDSLLILLTAMVLSLRKPWGMTSYGLRMQYDRNKILPADLISS